jgi:hypothetical protein
MVYKGLSDSPSLTVESRNEVDDNFRVRRGFFCCRDDMSSPMLMRHRYGNIVEVVDAGVDEEGHLEEEARFKKSFWPLE